jgi:hypothetical protein
MLTRTQFATISTSVLEVKFKTLQLHSVLSAAEFSLSESVVLLLLNLWEMIKGDYKNLLCLLYYYYYYCYCYYSFIRQLDKTQVKLSEAKWVKTKIKPVCTNSCELRLRMYIIIQQS